MGTKPVGIRNYRESKRLCNLCCLFHRSTHAISQKVQKKVLVKEKYSTAQICHTLELKIAKIKLTLQAMGNNMV